MARKAVGDGHRVVVAIGNVRFCAVHLGRISRFKMTDPKALIEEARKLDAKATQGPWETCSWGDYSADFDCIPREVYVEGADTESLPTVALIVSAECVYDAALIARSRTLLGELADALEEALDVIREREENAWERNR